MPWIHADRCKKRHFYAKVGFTWQKSGKYLVRQCCKCASDRKKAWRAKPENQQKERLRLNKNYQPKQPGPQYINDRRFKANRLLQQGVVS
jgi:hypothetical protein